VTGAAGVLLEELELLELLEELDEPPVVVKAADQTFPVWLI
jgi:hypothetical protein